MYTKYSRAKKAFVLDGVVLSGVHKCIQELFFPAYHRELARFGNTDAIPRVAMVAEVVPVVPAARGKGRSNSPARKPRKRSSPFAYMQQGMKIGRKVDKELKDLCKVQPKTRLKKLPLLHPQTKKILAALNDEQLGLDRAQVCVGALQYRLGTAVDMVCVDLTEESKLPVVIEVKSGWQTDYYRHTRYNMSSPFEDLDDSPANQHQIQLAVNVALYCMSYYDQQYVYEHIQAMKAYVIRAVPHRDEVDVIPLKDWARQRIPQMLAAILQRSSRLRGIHALPVPTITPVTSAKHTRQVEEKEKEPKEVPVVSTPKRPRRTEPSVPIPTNSFARIKLW